MEKIYKNKVDIFNFLRVFALFSVLGTHSRISISSFFPQFNVYTSFPMFTYTLAWTAMGMFFILSGYLLGKGFFDGKYKADIKGMVSFWITRLLRILPMYLFFIIVLAFFAEPEVFWKENYKILVPLLTFTLNGVTEPSTEYFGATWFISTIMQLYLLTPVFYKII